MNGSYDINTLIEDSLNLFATMYNFQVGQYKKLGEKLIERVCSTLYNKIFREYLEKVQGINLKLPGKLAPSRLVGMKFMIS